jgi:hypothetical protein
MLTITQKTELTDEFTRQLIILSNISTKSCKAFLENLIEQNNEVAKWHQEISKNTQAKKTLAVDSTFFDTVIFLSAFEITYVSTIDRICLLYIQNGHDLYDALRNKFATDFENVGKVSTFTKFQFLREHHLDILIRADDNELRNKIAHFNFMAVSNGKVNVQNKIIDVPLRIFELYNFVTDVTLALTDAIKKLTADIERRTKEIERKNTTFNNLTS